MKKLIAISITLALVASAAFAQVTVSGKVSSQWVAFKSFDGADASNSFNWGGRLRLDAQDADGTFGASLRVLEGVALNASDWAYAWWQPIKQVKLTLGAMSDGWYAVDDLVGWGFYAEANDFVVYKAYDADKIYKKAAFADGGLFNKGVSLLITPLDGLKVAFGLPAQENFDDVNAMETWKHFFLQAAYDLNNIGIITLTYQSGKQDMASTWNGGNPDASKIYASFQLKMIENLGLHFGVNYTFPVEQGGGSDVKENSPIALGLGAEYGAGDFGIKARLEFLFLGNYDNGTDKDPDPFNFDIEVMPYYDLGIVKAFLRLGLGLTTDDEDENGVNKGDMHATWVVNPYVVKTVGAGSFYAGFQLYGEPKPDGMSGGVQKYANKIGWGVPIGLNFYF